MIITLPKWVPRHPGDPLYRIPENEDAWHRSMREQGERERKAKVEARKAEPVKAKPRRASKGKKPSATPKFPDPSRKPGGQMRKGYTANENGRPIKAARAVTLRQHATDVLSVGEEVVVVDGKKVSTVVAILRGVANRALAGDRMASKQFLTHHEAALRYNAENSTAVEMLETVERFVHPTGDIEADKALEKMKNELRAKTRPG